MDDIMAFSEAVDINIKVGKNTDASGPLTLFSRLQQVSDFVDTLETKLGLNTDSSGTTTIFSRLAQISAYVDTLETSIGTNSDASGTSTVFARLAQIAAYVDQVEGYTDTLETLLGLTGDVASGTGSVMARLAQLIAYTDTVETVLGTVNTNVNSANTTLGTVNTNVSTANTNINTTNTRVGASTDAAGTSTLFALLKKLDTAMSAATTPNGYYTPSSSTIIYQDATVRSLTIDTSYIVIARFMPLFTGDIFVTCDIQSTVGGATVFLSPMSAASTIGNTPTLASFNMRQGFSTNWNNMIAGAVITSSAFNDQVILGGTNPLTTANATYGTYTMCMGVTAGVPVYFVGRMVSGYSTSANYKNFAIKGDITRY